MVDCFSRAPSFTCRLLRMVLNDFLDVMNEQSRILVEILSEMSKTQNEIDIFKRLGLCALDIIMGKFDEFIYIKYDSLIQKN